MPRRNDISKILIIGSTIKRLAFATLFLVCLGLLAPAHACTRSLARVAVTSDFRVIVMNGSTPVPGVQVEVYDERNSETEGKPILTLVTSKDGSAEIKNLHKGLYIVGTTGPGGGSAVYAAVSANLGEPVNRIILPWPQFISGAGILKTKTLTGVLATDNLWKPFQNVHVELWRAGAKAPLATEETGTEGRFQFQEAKPGIYILRIRGEQNHVDYDRQIEGEIPIELLPAAATLPEPLSLHVGMTTCGLHYSPCAFPGTNALPSRRFQLLDPAGEIIADAKYRVLDPSGAEVEKGLTDSNGIVRLSSDLNGKVTLIVSTKAFTLKQPLDLLPPDDPASYLRILLGVGLGDECNAASLEKNATSQ